MLLMHTLWYIMPHNRIVVLLFLIVSIIHSQLYNVEYVLVSRARRIMPPFPIFCLGRKIAICDCPHAFDLWSGATRPSPIFISSIADKCSWYSMPDIDCLSEKTIHLLTWVKIQGLCYGTSFFCCRIVCFAVYILCTGVYLFFILGC